MFHLQHVNWEAAARIHPRDTQKLMRALEVRMLTRAALPPVAAAEPLTGYRTLVLGLSPPRARLAEAKGQLDMLKARLAELLNGSRPEEIQQSEAAAAKAS